MGPALSPGAVGQEMAGCAVLGGVLVKLIESNAALRKVFVTE